LWPRFVRGVQYRWNRYHHPSLSPENQQRVLDFFAEHRVVVALAEFGPTGVLFASVCQAANVPLYVHFHGYDASLVLRNAAIARRYRRLFRNAAGIIAPSGSLVERLRAIGCPENLLHVCPHGIDPARFAITRRLPLRIVAVGRLVDKKAPHLTIRAFAQVAQRFPDARLDMIGDGPLAETCRALIVNLELERQVFLHGVQPRENVARLMEKASVFVQHSVTAPNGDAEGLPVAILEAMTSALPVVATRHSGIPEVVVHGATGLLVDENDVDGMAVAMSQLLSDPEMAEKMGRSSRERILRHFTLQQSLDRLRAVMCLSQIGPSILAKSAS
jgi:colanic acid/amylovoran biosynthesis glycosyltransferase